ncbi:MAG: hypothetical protein U0232_13710 [Thermomicrobiales bacterium]
MSREKVELQRARASIWTPLALGALTLLGWLLWLPYLDAPLHVDAAGYATAAYWWANGDTLYQDLTITRPQGIFVVFRAIEAVGLGSSRGIHIAAALVASACALALYAVVASIWDRKIALGSAALFTLLFATPVFDGYTANAELFMLLPLLFSLALLLRADAYPLGGWRTTLLLAGSGFLIAAATLIKPAAVVTVPLAGLWLLLRALRERASWRVVRWAGGALAVGLVLGGGPAILHGWRTVPDLYFSAVLFYRVTQDSVLTETAGSQVARMVQGVTYIVFRLPILLFVPLGMWTLRRSGARAATFWWLWFGSSYAGVALGGSWTLHYYQQLVPSLAVAAVLGLNHLLSRPRRGGWLLAQALALAVGGVLLVTLVDLQAHGPRPADMAEYANSPVEVVSEIGPIAAYLRAHTAADETIFVAYDQADIYYLSQRRPAIRWIYPRELKWTPGAFAELVARLDDPATAPRYVVGAQPFDASGFDRDGALRAVIARDYRVETVIGPVQLYRRIN